MDVLIYAGPGTSQQGVTHLQAALKHLLSDYAVRLVTAKALAKEPWERSTALLVFPGGRDLPYVEHLRGTANGRIKAYVEAGGRFLGVCAGAYYASAHVAFEMGTPFEVTGPRELAFYQGSCTGATFPGFIYDSEAGARDAALIWEHNSSRFQAYWNGGGHFESSVSIPNCQVIARYEDLPSSSPAIVLCGAGQGKALLSGVHPEHPSVADGARAWNDVFSPLLRLLDLAPHPEKQAVPIEPTPQYLHCAEHEQQQHTARHLLQTLGVPLPGIYQDQSDAFVFARTTDSDPTKATAHRIVLDCPLAQAKTAFNPQTFFAARKSASIGQALLVSDVVTSTQSLLDKNAKLLDAVPNGLLSIAGRQTLGRGRGANAWVSPLGSLMFSLVLKVPGSMASCLVFLQYLFALSAVEALEDRVKLCLKWPNDIYADVGSNGPERYKKVGGVLVNTSYTRGQFNVVIGCGLNIANEKPTLSLNELALRQDQRATPLGLESALAAIMDHFDATWADFVRTRSFAAYEQRYLDRWIHGGQAVIIEASDESAVIEGITLDHGLLRTRVTAGPNAGRVVDLQPDGNSFDMLHGLIKTKA